MKKESKVLVTITGGQTDPEGVSSQMEIITPGVLSTGDGHTSITYHEADAFGSEDVLTTVEVREDAVRVFRHGDYGADFSFRKGQKSLSLYRTPFGTIEMGAYPTQVSSVLGDGEGEVFLCYQIDLQGKYIGQNSLRIAWMPQEGAP